MKQGISHFNISLIDIHALWEETHAYIYTRWLGYLNPVKIVDLTNDSITTYFYHRLNEQLINSSDLTLSTVNIMSVKHANQLAVLGIDGYVYEILNWLEGHPDTEGNSVSYSLLVETHHIERTMVEAMTSRDRRGDMVMIDLGVDPYYLAVKIYGFKE